MNWKQVEQSFARQFKCTLLHDKAYQNKDIDAISSKGNTISIKHHVSATRTGNLAFEYELIDPINNKSIAGNFVYCQADLHADLIGDTWYVFDAKELKEWVDANKHKYRYISLSNKASAENSNWGRGVFTQSKFYLIPLKDIEQLAKHKVKMQ